MTDEESEYKYPRVIYSRGNRWYVVKYDYTRECFCYLCLDLQWHSPGMHGLSQYWYDTKELAQDTLNKWEATYP